MANDYEDYERGEMVSDELERLRNIERAITEFLENNKYTLKVSYKNNPEFLALLDALTD